MDGILIVIVFIVAIIGSLWFVVGPWAVFLLLAVVVFAGYMLLKPNYQKDANCEYVERAFQFIEFYEKLPHKSFLLITPEMIGVRLPSEIAGGYPGIVIKTYQELNLRRVEGGTSVPEAVFEKDIAKYIGGEANVRRFRKLSLEVKLHDNDDDQPVIYMPLFCGSGEKREHYVKVIKWKYKKEYGKELKIYHLEKY